MGASGGQRGNCAENDISDFIHASALSALDARENSVSTFIQGHTDPEPTTVLLILSYHDYIANRERLFAISIFSQDVLKDRRASEDDLWGR